MERRTRGAAPPLIDADIHNSSPEGGQLEPYLSARWRDHHRTIGTRLRVGGLPPRPVPGAHRLDAWPPSGLRPGADLAFTRTQYLDPWTVEFAIVNTLTPAADQLDVRFGAALASAVNRWLIAEWLDREPRLRGSVVLPYEDAALSVAEIDRCASHPGFVQVLFKCRTLEPLGSRRYWPIYEAAARNGMPVGVHYGGRGSGAMFGAGRLQYYVEERHAMAQAFQAQVTSLVCAGVFEAIPELKIVLIEGGFAWLPSLMWRLDSRWKSLHREVPELRRAPSEYVREHFWVTTQPIEEPPRSEDFEQLLGHMSMNERILFSSDYPHWDFDSPALAVPTSLPAGVRRMIMTENARALYDLPPSPTGSTTEAASLA